MRRIARKLALVLGTLVLFSLPAFAAGGTCPTASTYIIQGGSPGTLSSAGITSCYFISKSLGSDSNNGTSESTPWAHLPGMPSCTSTCNSASLTSGEGFILRGGDTWTNSDLGVNWGTSGTSSHPIYIGVDPAWPSSGWTRPIFTCGGSVCSNGSSSSFVSISNQNYVTVDNIEMTGLDCPSCGEKDDEFVYCLGIGCEVEHTYMHGWTMSGSPSFDPAAMFVDSSNGDAAVAGCLFHDNIVDGSDSSQNGFTGPSYCQTVYNNYVKYVHVCYFWSMNVIHDNVCEDIVISITGDHANGYAWFGLIGGATNGLFYNNIQRHSTACSGCVNFYLFQLTSANSGYHVYFFNNLGYDMDAANIVDLAGSGASGNYGTWYLFNNTIECGNDSSQTTCYNGQSGVTMALSDINNHWIGPSNGSSQCGGKGVGGTCTSTTPLAQTVATANSFGYTSSQTNAFSPTSGGSPTVGSGTTESSLCTTISGINAAAGTACGNSTSYGPAYNTSNHTLSWPALALNARANPPNIGAYQFSGGTSYTLTTTVTGSGSLSSSPSGISCPSTCSASYSSGIVVTLTETPSGGNVFTGWSGGGCSGTATTCAVTMSAAESVTATFVSAPVLSLTVTGSGVVTSSPVGILCPGTCSNNFTSGTNITLSAVASGSYVFSGWYGGGCSGTLTCSLTLTANTSITAVFAQTGTPSLLTNNLTATSTACAIASNIVTITASNTFTANSWIGLSGFTTCTQLNGQILLTNSSTNSTKVVGTLYNVQKVAQTLSNLSTTSDTTGYLQGQGWNPFVTAPFPLCNGSPSCVVTPTVGTWAYDFSIPGPGSDNAPTSPIVAIADYGVSATSLSVSASGESYDHEISLPDGSGNYMYCLVNQGRCDIFSGHVDSSVCNNVPCFVPDVVLDSKAWNHTPVNYGAFSRNLTKRPGTHKALWYSLYESTPYASPFWLKSDVLSYSANQVTSTLTTNLYDISTCPGFGYVTIGTGLAFSGALITDNFDDKVEFILGSGTQGGPGRHMQFVVSLTNGTCETLDTDGMTGTAVYTYGVTASHGGTAYTNGDTITGAYGDTYTATVSGGVVTALTQVLAGTGASLSQGNATTGGTGTGLEYDITGIGTIGTYATLYAPISSASCPAGTTLTCEAPITTGIYTFGIHAGGMLSNGQYTWLSGWGTSGQPGQCTGCDYVIWSVGNSPTLTGTTSGNQNGHPSGGFNWLGTASNPNYYLNRFLGAISDPTCANLSDCQLLYTLPSGGTGGNCSVSPGGSQMHSAVSTILNDDSLPILVTSSINTPGTPTQTNPPGFTCGLGQNSLFSIAKTGGTTWYAHHYENGNNHAGEQFEGTDTICTESPDAVFAICDEDMNYGFPGNTGLGSSLSSAAEPFSFMLNMGIPVIPYPSPMFGFF